VPDAFVEVRDLRKEFAVPAGSVGGLLDRWRGRRAPAANGHPPGIVAALDGVDFEIQEGEVVGIVGESGCGKSTLANCLLKLTEPTAGSMRIAGRNLNALDGDDLKRFRRAVQIVFQDPTAALDPRWTVAESVAEPLEVHGLAAGRELDRRRLELVADVGLRPDHLRRYPHELSGGERQRVCIARALATKPRLLVLDEPTSALDASTRVHILKLLTDLRREHGMTYLIISHDLSVVRSVCDRVLVMYLGRIVETGRSEPLFSLPLHPYTEALLSAIPVPDPDVRKERIRLRGEATTTIVDGCRLAPRCPRAVEICAVRPQRLTPWRDGRPVACHRITDGEIEPTPVLGFGAGTAEPAPVLGGGGAA
jgi:oligopeptide transport system ATP-binding protein